MSKNFKSYVRDNASNPTQTNSNPGRAKERTNGRAAGASEEEIRSSVNTYSRMDESQLMSEMMKIANEEKTKGNLNNEELKKFYNQVSPMLSETQRNRLKALINTLK